MTSWSFLTNHARVLLCITRDPGARLRVIAASLGLTERSAHGIVTDLAEAGYVVKQKDGRRNRYQIQAHLPLPEAASQEPAIGEVLAVLAGHRREAAADRDGTSLRPPAAAVVSAEWHESMTEVTRHMSIRERPQEVHLHLHGPSAQDVAAIVAQRGEEKPPWPPLSS